MSALLTDAWHMLVPENGDKNGPLAPLLVTLTLVTGLVDAFSYLVLGHVFVANMTGNVVFLAFALAGARGFSLLASLVALGAFSLGALAGGRLGARISRHRGHLLLVAVVLEAALVTAAAFMTSVVHHPGVGPTRYALITVLSLAMGTQNAVARRLAVPDLTTTVLTLTITGISADSRLAGGGGSKAGRRLVSALSMFVGALVGALLVLKVTPSAAPWAALGLLAPAAVATALLSRSDPAWVRP